MTIQSSLPLILVKPFKNTIDPYIVIMISNLHKIVKYLGEEVE